MKLPENFQAFVKESEDNKLYKALILQLNKDLLNANIDLEFHPDTLPMSLKLILQEAINKLINDRFNDYLNLLYIVDVSEQKVRALEMDDTNQLSEEVTFLILQREFQKVWYRQNLG